MSIIKSIILGSLLVMTGMGTSYASYSTTATTADAKAYAKVENYIFEAEEKTGVDANLISAVAMIESQFGKYTNNPYNHNVGGVMQHSRKQWNADVKKHSKKLGLSAKVSVNNKRASILVGAAGLADNRSYLEQHSKKAVTDGDVYISWLVGLYGTEKILNGNPHAKISKYIRVTKGNWALYTVNGKIATVQQFRSKINHMVNTTKGKVDALANNGRMNNLVAKTSEENNARNQIAMLR